MTISVFWHMPQGWVCWVPAAKSKSRQRAAVEADPADGSRRAPKAERPQPSHSWKLLDDFVGVALQVPRTIVARAGV